MGPQVTTQVPHKSCTGNNWAMKKKPDELLHIGDFTTQLYGDPD